MKDRSTLLALLAALAALFSGASLAVTWNDDGEVRVDVERAAPARDFTTIPAPGGPVVVDRDQVEQPAELRDARRTAPSEGVEPDLHEDTVDEVPPGITPAQVEQGAQNTEALAREQLDKPVRPAGAQAYSCPARPVVNQSGLSGRRVGVALHFTVSNPGSLDAIRGMFNRPSFGASSNYGFELYNLRCQQWVPNGRKAWAQGAANSAYISIEIISNDRSRASWLATPAFKRGVLAALVRDLARGVGAPLRRVNPSGCTWTPGIVDHDALECGNTHWDVGTHFPWDVFMRQVRQGVASTSYLTKRERAIGSARCSARRAVIRSPKGSVLRRQRLAASRARRRDVRAAITRLDRVHAAGGTWRTRHRGARRKQLAGYFTGKACR